MKRKSPRALAVWPLSLGCPKNRVDSEHLLGSLGLPVRPVAHVGRARLVFINTCGFIEPAVRESVRAVAEAIEHISRLKNKPLLAVAGCLVGRYGARTLAEELPEVDLWLPTDALDSWPAMVRQALGIDGEDDADAGPGGSPPAAGGAAARLFAPGRLLSTGPSYAWLKVGEGCRHKCAFCAIPSIRGGLKSVPADVLLAEARALVDGGTRELALVAQDVTAWGTDLAHGGTIIHLLERLMRLDGLAWLRLLYLYPSGVTDDLLRFMADAGGGPLLPYLDIPLQHAHPDVLSRMGRPFAGDPRRVIDRVRRRLPDAALRTTFITGFPGETDAHFRELCRFVEEARFLSVGVFAYQREEGTPAFSMPGQVPADVAESRRDELMALQKGISRELLAECEGRRLPVLVDSANPEWPGLHNGRVWFQAPEVDGQTYVSGPGVEPGRLITADIVEAADYDLTALA